MLKLYKYNIPLVSPFRVAGNEFNHREGVILVYKDRDSGIEAYGEVAPLPGFSDETLEQVIEVLKINREHLSHAIKTGNGKETLQLLDQIHQFSALSFGIDTLLHDLASKKAGKSLVQYLFDKEVTPIESNGTLSIKEKSAVISEAQQLVDSGFHTLKVKVGDDFNKERKILTSLRQKFPEIKIRIDANQAWSAEEAIANLESLNNLNIEYCEQPVHKDDLQSLAKITQSVDIPIAADESVRNKNSAEKLLQLKAVNLLILKPMMMGTFNNIFVTKELADTHDIEVVFTTSLESAIGRSATAAISAGLGNSHRAQGLATGAQFKKDIAQESWLNAPEIKFPNTLGLGISLHLEGLKEL